MQNILRPDPGFAQNYHELQCLSQTMEIGVLMEVLIHYIPAGHEVHSEKSGKPEQLLLFVEFS